MKKRRDWIVVGIVAAVLAVAVVLAGTVVAGASGKSAAPRTSPSDWPTPSPSASVVLQVGYKGTLVKQYTLADLQALGQGSFIGYAGFMNSGDTVYGPEAISGIRVTDIVQDALQAQLTTAQSVAFIGIDGYSQTYTGDQILNVDRLTQMYSATTKKAASTSSYTGPFAAVLCYSDPGGQVMAQSEALRLMVADASNEPVVMTGSDSVKWVAKLNVSDTVVKNWSLKLTGLKIKGKRQVRTITRNDFQSCVNCHGSSYKLSGHKYSGTPLYLLVGEVDGGATMDYNAALAKKGYRIEIVSTKGKTRIVSSRTIIDKRNILLAWQRDGALLGSSAFPLRLVGAKLSASQELGRIKSVGLLPPVKK
jgi:hypothetical protein